MIYPAPSIFPPTNSISVIDISAGLASQIRKDKGPRPPIGPLIPSRHFSRQFLKISISPAVRFIQGSNTTRIPLQFNTKMKSQPPSHTPAASTQLACLLLSTFCRYGNCHNSGFSCNSPATRFDN